MKFLATLMVAALAAQPQTSSIHPGINITRIRDGFEISADCPTGYGIPMSYRTHEYLKPSTQDDYDAFFFNRMMSGFDAPCVRIGSEQVFSRFKILVYTLTPKVGK